MARANQIADSLVEVEISEFHISTTATTKAAIISIYLNFARVTFYHVSTETFNWTATDKEQIQLGNPSRC